MEKIWRLILDVAREPGANMSIDEAIMICQSEASSAEALPTLRIYKWLYPCISIGRFQKPLTFTLSPKGREEGEGGNNLPIVRRPTGGGAVFHNEFGFTYSIACREDSNAVPKGASNSYREIHLGILRALRNFGFKVELCAPVAEEGRSYPAKFCFDQPVRFDIVSGFRKIAGAAQRRKQGVILHQGEVSLGLDVWLRWPYNKMVKMVTNSLSRRLKARFIEERISDREMSLAEELLKMTGGV
ncbi:MAG: hypothetical protein V1933_08345 [Candidatus Omnitrophota bacterium]